MKISRFLILVLAVVMLLSLCVFADSGADDETDIAVTVLIIVILPAVVAFVMMFAKLSQMKTAVKQNYADNYMKRETFELTRANDIYLYSNTVRTPIPKNKN